VSFLVADMFSFGRFVPVKRLAGKIVSKMTYIVSSGTLNLAQLYSIVKNAFCSFRIGQVM